MSLYSWSGPEEILSGPCTVNLLTIETLTGVDRSDGKKFARGTIGIVDYIEGSSQSDPWDAIGIPNNDDSFDWVVKRSSPENDEFVWQGENGEYHFTLDTGINAAMSKYIAKVLNLYLGGNPPSTKIPRYEGRIVLYEGPCCCSLFEKPGDFNWEAKTNGEYPKLCFQCSCGEKWWCYDEEKNAWGPVKDPKAWEMLLKYNGIAVKLIEPFRDGFYLMSSIRNSGFVPIG